MRTPLRFCGPRQRELAAALGLLTLATLCCFHKLAMHPGELLVGPQKHGHNDLVDYFVPSREFAAQSIRDGEWPFWNTNICLGVPYTGNPQSALYYPPNWLTLVWSPRDCLSWLLVAHHLFAGLGVYCLSRRYGMSWSAGVLGGILFLGSPFLIAQTAEGHYPQICAVAWIPWAFLAYERFRRSRTTEVCGDQTARFGGVALMAAVLAACFFCGHAQETYYLVLLLTGCVAADSVACRRRGEGRGAFSLLTGWVLCGVTSIGLVAIDLVPVYLATLRSARPGLHQQADGFGWTGMTLESWRELFDPFALTRPELWEPGTTPFWEKLFYFGVMPLVLAGIGIIAGRRAHSARRMAVLWIVTAAFAFGARGDAYQILTRVLPGLGWFREPSRILFFTSFATAILAANGWDAVRRFVAARRSGWAPRFLWLAVLVPCIGELAWFAGQVTDTATMQTLDERSPELAGLLKAAAPGHRVLAPQSVVSDLDAVQLRIPKVSGYEPTGPVTYLMVNTRLQGTLPQIPDPMGFLPADPLQMDRRWLELLSVRYAVRPAANATDFPNGWRRVETFRMKPAVRRRGETHEVGMQSWDLLELESTLPRASVAGQSIRYERFAGFAEQLPTLDPRLKVALDVEILPEHSHRVAGNARILEESPTQLSVGALLDGPGYLVLSDLWFPGWTAKVDGDDAAVLKANGAFRAVALPAGAHTVTFSYRPRGLAIGMLLTAMTVVLLIWQVGRRLTTPSTISDALRRLGETDSATRQPVAR